MPYPVTVSRRADPVAPALTAFTARRAEVLAPPIGRFIDVDGARLHYLDRGAGPAVVMVHGLAGNLRNFYAALRWLIAWTLMAPLGKLAHQATLKAVFAPELVPSSFDADSGGALGLRPHSFIAASKDMLTVSSELALMTPRYPSLAIPVDVIFGRQDPILDYQAHGERLVAALPHATLHLIEGGHMIPITVADQIMKRIKQAAEVT